MGKWQVRTLWPADYGKARFRARLCSAKPFPLPRSRIPTAAFSKSWAAAARGSLQGRGHPARPPGCAQVSHRKPRPRPPGLGAIPARGPHRLRLESSQHLHHPRYRRVRRLDVHSHGAARGVNAQAPHRREAAYERATFSISRSRLPTRLRPLMPRAWRTAILSLPTSSSRSAGKPRYSTSAWPNCCPNGDAQPRPCSQARDNLGDGGVHVARAGARPRQETRSLISEREGLALRRRGGLLQGSFF